MYWLYGKRIAFYNRNLCELFLFSSLKQSWNVCVLRVRQWAPFLCGYILHLKGTTGANKIHQPLTRPQMIYISNIFPNPNLIVHWRCTTCRKFWKHLKNATTPSAHCAWRTWLYIVLYAFTHKNKALLVCVTLCLPWREYDFESPTVVQDTPSKKHSQDK